MNITRNWFAHFAFLLLTANVVYAQQTDIQFVVVDELYVRNHAIKTVTPDFPVESKRSKSQGVAVAQLSVNRNGDVERVEVLEAPDVSIKQAVADAARQWKFSPSKVKGKAVAIRGKLTFYFVIDKQGNGRVETPRPLGRGN